MQPRKRTTRIVAILGIIGLIFCFSLLAFINTKAPSASVESALVEFIGEQAMVFMRGSEKGYRGYTRAEARGTIRKITGDWVILEARDEYVLCAKAHILKVVIEK